MTRVPLSGQGASASGPPLSDAIVSGEHVFLSGQVPLDPETGSLVEGDIGTLAGRCLDNLAAVLARGGMSLEDVVKVNVYLTSIDDLAGLNEVYAGRFTEPYPARTTVAVAALPLGSRIEIELVARLP